MKDWTGSAVSREAVGKIRKVFSSCFLALALLFFIPGTGLAVGKGAQGPDVYVIQGMLKSLGSYSGQINGYYDDVTARGVKHFQKKHGLPATGSVDKRTLNRMVYSYDRVVSNPHRGGGKGIGGGAGQGGGKGIGGGAGQGGGAGIGGGAGQGGGKGIGGGAGQGGGEGIGGGAGQGGGKGIGGGAGQ
ncbi:peptidoglycan-binding domain-containing protein, partial [Brevibacillus parabrevis]|uniref:peptidoglycan-binding domain-containing protein n=1 Tax=Brevibacillus parabrevis TaxID=54914 RepID=UPI0028D67F4A